jgi:hypothetical protein
MLSRTKWKKLLKLKNNQPLKDLEQVVETQPLPTLQTNRGEMPAFPFLSKDSFESEEAYLKAKSDYEKGITHFPGVPHEVLKEYSDTGFNKIRFTAGLLESIIVSFGKVNFSTNDNGEIKLSFDYETEGKPKFRMIGKEEMEKLLGDFLMSLIEEEMRQKKALFRGGKDEMEKYINDENRTNNIEESGSQ